MADPMIKNFKILAKTVHEMRNANSHKQYQITGMGRNTKGYIIKYTKNDIDNALKNNGKINIDNEIKALEKIVNGLKKAQKKKHSKNFKIGTDFAETLLISAQNYKKDLKQNTFLEYLEEAITAVSETTCSTGGATIGGLIFGPVGAVGGYIIGHMGGGFLSKSLIEQTLTLYDNL
ncbi:hypothetical protein BLOT_010168 [Blomia tropicalis]|nr:hypothetical protein BLOT_010168 [Blomia tropicalis]